MSSGLDRRQLLALGGIGALAAGARLTFGSSTLATAAPAAAAAKWSGHKPGQIYLGASSDNLPQLLSATGGLGLRRTYYSWTGGTGEGRAISEDHAAGRMPWISYKPPSTRPGGWAQITSGRYDADIRARARRYAGYAKPVIVTFNHEPHNDSTGSPTDFANAWTHIHDVMANETGLKNVVDVPIIGDWTFNPVNKNGHPETFITEAVLARCAFLGIDLYQNKSGQGYTERLGRILAWLDARGHSSTMVGLGETGCTNGFGTPDAAQWWTASWSWAVAHASRVAAISYFNSARNNNSGNTWALSESAAKLAAFRASLASTVSCTL